MMHKCTQLLSSTKGETLTEGLASILIAVLSVTFLAAAVMASANINHDAQTYATSFYKQATAAEAAQDDQEAGSMKIGNKEYNVDYSGGNLVAAYRFNQTPLQTAIAEANKTMEDNKAEWSVSNSNPLAVARKYVATVGVDNVYRLSDEDIALLLNGTPFPALQSSHLRLFLLPSCVYVNGEAVNFQIIQGSINDSPASTDSQGLILRPIAFLYNGKVYGCFDQAGTNIVYGMYVFYRNGPPWNSELHSKLWKGAWTVDQWFANAERPGAIGNKGGNGQDGLIITGGTY